MNNEVIFQVNAPLTSSTNYDCIKNVENINGFEDHEFTNDCDNSDLSLPINNIGRMMKLSVPGTAKISRESKVLMQRISKDFIGCISSQAGEICTNNKRRVLNGEDIINALYSFGFGDYTDTLINYLNIWRGVKHSRGIRPFNIYKSSNSQFNINDSNLNFTDNTNNVHITENNSSFGYNCTNKPQFNNTRPIDHRYFPQSNIQLNNQQFIHSNFQKCTNDSSKICSQNIEENNYNSIKYFENHSMNQNAPFIANKSYPNPLLLSPTRSINFINEASPITPKQISLINKFGKRTRVIQDDFSFCSNIADTANQSTNTSLYYNINYTKNPSDNEFTEKKKYINEYKSESSHIHSNRTELSSYQYKQDDVFINKNEGSFDNFFSSDLYILDESENESEHSTYPNGVFTS
ncbi:CCAAT-box DNA binding protein subunit B [Cryptosporidium canis]|nr:CCAAT-box DNA binding protein subunit B [Cryptosporidium canis]